jgi:hypothetical protein
VTQITRARVFRSPAMSIALGAAAMDLHMCKARSTSQVGIFMGSIVTVMESAASHKAL